MTRHTRFSGFLFFAAKWFVLQIVLASTPRAWATVGTQSVNDGFDPEANALVAAMAVQADGKIVVGGAFTMIGGQNRNYIARLNADGSLDTTFIDPDASAQATAVAIQADGKAIVGGLFTTILGETHKYIVRLNADGSPDETFSDPNLDELVNAVAVQSDGKILVGGAFSMAGGQNRQGVARLNPNGSLDETFIDPMINGPVFALALQSDGKVIAAGSFTVAGNQSYGSIARLNADGSLDASFANPGASGEVYTLAIQADGRVIVGGQFDVSTDGGLRATLVRLTSDGTFDTTFLYSGFDGTAPAVFALAMQADGKIMVGGVFAKVNLQNQQNIARLAWNGAWDSTFANPHADNTVYALAVQSDGKVVAGGQFATLNGVTRNDIGRLDTFGNLDATLSASITGGEVNALTVQSDGHIIVAGGFTAVGGTARAGIARLNTVGGLDPYNPNPTAPLPAAINSLALQPDGKLLVAGYFTNIGNPSQARNKIARLNADGSVDSGFDANQNPGDFVSTMAVQADGKIVIGGPFTYICGKTRNHIARLNADGTLDLAFDPNADNGVGAIVIQPDGKLLVGGSLTTIAGGTRHGLARLYPDGTLDDTFVDPDATGGGVSTIAVQADGKIVVGGGFTSIGGQTHYFIARLNGNGSLDTAFAPTPDNYIYALALRLDGKIVVGGVFTNIDSQPRANLARLNADGTVDATFIADANNAVDALVFQPDGKLVVGVSFTTLGGQTRGEVARISGPDAALQSFGVIGYGDGSGSVSWMRAGADADLDGPPVLQFSTDYASFTNVGPMQRIDGGWRYNGIVLPPPDTYFFLRVTGLFSSGQVNGSGGVTGMIGRFYLQSNDGIFANGFD